MWAHGRGSPSFSSPFGCVAWLRTRENICTGQPGPGMSTWRVPPGWRRLAPSFRTSAAPGLEQEAEPGALACSASSPSYKEPSPPGLAPATTNGVGEAGTRPREWRTTTLPFVKPQLKAPLFWGHPLPLLNRAGCETARPRLSSDGSHCHTGPIPGSGDCPPSLAPEALIPQASSIRNLD